MNTELRNINVMLVDDSSVIRGALTRMLESSDHISIIKSVADGSAGVFAAEMAQPDIVILDIEMPVMDGLTALPKIIEAAPKTKVIMFSSLTEKGATVTIEAMKLGAVECLVKPSSAQDVGEGSAFHKQMVALIESLAPADCKRSGLPASKNTPSAPSDSIISGSFSLYDDAMSYKGKPSIVAIGSSTGGPQALFTVLKHCKNFDVPIIVTQHMPATFTKILAEHIEQQTGIVTLEGQTGMVLEKGKIYVAPGGFHMLFENKDERLTIKLDEGPPVNFCKPAVDPMFDSIVGIHANKVLGVILTGMGHDGRDSCKRLVEKRGRVIAQDEQTSVVWGMPGAAAQANICSAVLPVDEIGPWIKKAVMG